MAPKKKRIKKDKPIGGKPSRVPKGFKIKKSKRITKDKPIGGSPYRKKRR